MKSAAQERRARRAAAGVFLCAVLVLSARADIIDRIAVSVGNRVITVSDIDREIRVTAFLEGAQPDLSPKGRRATAERLVEQRLIQRELDTSRYPQPDAAEIEPILADFKERHYRGDAAYQRALAEYGITDQDVRDELLWARRLMRFIGIRFRPGVRVSEPEIQKYFEETVAPAARTAHPGEEVLVDDYRQQIEEKLAGDLADTELNVWLTEARRRNEIIFHEEVFR